MQNFDSEWIKAAAADAAAKLINFFSTRNIMSRKCLFYEKRERESTSQPRHLAKVHMVSESERETQIIQILDLARTLIPSEIKSPLSLFHCMPFQQASCPPARLLARPGILAENARSRRVFIFRAASSRHGTVYSARNGWSFDWIKTTSLLQRTTWGVNKSWAEFPYFVWIGLDWMIIVSLTTKWFDLRNNEQLDTQLSSCPLQRRFLDNLAKFEWTS